jgi:hypothetical protein
MKLMVVLAQILAHEILPGIHHGHHIPDPSTGRKIRPAVPWAVYHIPADILHPCLQQNPNPVPLHHLPALAAASCR